jgi:Protein of unknown function (DUF1217)
MSVFLSGSVLTLFQDIASSDTSASGAILSVLYGSATASGGSLAGLDPITALTVAQRDQTVDIKQEQQLPAVAQAITAFTKAVNSATSIQQLVQNPNFLNVFLTANGLGDQTDYTALAAKALMSDPTNGSSLANQLSATNSQWLSVAQTYNFASNGLSAIQNSKAMSAVTSGYAEVLWRQSLDQQVPGLSNALYFLQNGSSFSSADEILGNEVARSVVSTAFNIPLQIAYQDLPAQEKAVSTAMDVTKLQSPQYVQTVADLYLTQMQLQASSASGSLSLEVLAVQSQSSGLIA